MASISPFHRLSRRRAILFGVAALGLLCFWPMAIANEPSAVVSPALQMVVEVTFRHGDQSRQVAGRVLAEDDEGGVLLEENDGRRWVIEAGDVEVRKETPRPFAPLTPQELSSLLLQELPEGFHTHLTPHYVICTNTSRAYGQWAGSLMERLHRAFTNYWRGRGAEIVEPEFPLVVMVYATRAQYQAASAEELGTPETSIIGYYSLATNRVSMYDLTGSAGLPGDGRRANLKSINQMLARPEAGPLVATVVHEATHQIAFNSGLGQRLADLPLWLVEGMAVYFEAPDLSSGRGWQGIGKVNYPRLETFRANLASGNRLSLLALVAEDAPLRNARTAPAAYADAWAMNYYLIRHQPKQYVAYVKTLSEQKPLETRTAEERIALFRTHFGEPAEVEQAMLKRMENVK